MGLISDLLGRKSVDGPPAERTIGDVETALDRLRSERGQARQQIDDALAERERLLLIDASDKGIAAADRSADVARLALERCEKVEPLLLRELEDLRSAAKRERWRGFRKRYDEAAAELVVMLRRALQKKAELHAIYDEARRAGFEHEIVSAFAPAPMMFGPEGLAHFEAAAERAREMGRPAPPAPPPPKMTPAEAEAAAQRAREFREGVRPGALAAVAPTTPKAALPEKGKA